MTGRQLGDLAGSTPSPGVAAGRQLGDLAGLAEALAQEPWARSLGLELLEVAPGRARVALTLAPHMVNFQGRPHGGVLFSLADTAFSAACNAAGEPAVALSVTIGFLASPTPGARLVAEAVVRRQGRRAGFYDVTVATADGASVATLQCVAWRPDPTASPGP